MPAKLSCVLHYETLDMSADLVKVLFEACIPPLKPIDAKSCLIVGIIGPREPNGCINTFFFRSNGI